MLSAKQNAQIAAALNHIGRVRGASVALVAAYEENVGSIDEDWQKSITDSATNAESILLGLLSEQDKADGQRRP